MNKTLKDWITILAIILPLILGILKLYIDFKIDQALLPIRLDLEGIKTNYAFWIKEISKEYK